MLSGLLLAAGQSSRFGSPKALASIGSSPAITTIVENILSAPLDELIVVLGADRQLIEPCLFKHNSIRVVYNKDHNLGQTSSVQTGLRHIKSNAEGFLIFPVDCPFVAKETIQSLIKNFEQHHPGILIPTHQGRRGHPPVFHIRFKDPILKMDTSKGLNHLIDENAAEVSAMEYPDPGVTYSFNTPEELARIKQAIAKT